MLQKSLTAQEHKPLRLDAKRGAHRSVDIMLTAALPGSALQQKLTGMSSHPSTPGLESTLSRQMSSFKMDWQVRVPVCCRQ